MSTAERVSFVGGVLEAAARGSGAEAVRRDDRAADVLAGLIAAGLVLERTRGTLALTRRGRRALERLRDAAQVRDDLGRHLTGQDLEHLAGRHAAASPLVLALVLAGLAALVAAGLGAWGLVAWAWSTTHP